MPGKLGCHFLWFIAGSVLVPVLEVHPLNPDVMIPSCKVPTLLGEGVWWHQDFQSS